MTTDVAGRCVLLVEDIVDTGLTLEKLRAHVLALGATSCAIVSLLDKVAKRKNTLVPEYRGFICAQAAALHTLHPTYPLRRS